MSATQLKESAVFTGITATMTSREGIEHWDITRHYSDGTSDNFSCEKIDLSDQYVASLASIIGKPRSGNDG